MVEKRRAGDRFSGPAILIGTALSVFAMAHHPSTGASGTAARLAEMVREAALSAFVHGGLIAMLLLVFAGLLGLAGALGWHLGRVRTGVVAYSAGVICMIGAALVSGFLVPGLAARYIDAAPAELEAIAPLFTLCFQANQALAKVGAVAQSVGIFCWSWVLLGERSWARGVGALGLAVGVIPVAGLVLELLHLDVHGMLTVVVAQAAWNIAVGIWLIRLGSRR